MSVSNFNFIAPFYDLLARSFFGKSLREAQQFHLGEIESKSTVLILGGGTGKIIDWLPDGYEITYLEQSEAMMKRAMKRGRAHFIHTDFQNHSVDKKFDWVICPFFLDCFDTKNLTRVLGGICQLLKEDGGLIVTDFHVSNKTQRWISNLMVGFFRLVSNLEATRLLPIQELISQQGLSQKESQLFRNGFIFSDIYRKKKPFG
ncbi:MAG: class I SAM-dependent methyltransferase [Cytophagales bacterium]|nr:class I SAM-dependent methyltransferase [Cytophagales bacterium]